VDHRLRNNSQSILYSLFVRFVLSLVWIMIHSWLLSHSNCLSVVMPTYEMAKYLLPFMLSLENSVNNIEVWRSGGTVPCGYRWIHLLMVRVHCSHREFHYQNHVFSVTTVSNCCDESNGKVTGTAGRYEFGSRRWWPMPGYSLHIRLERQKKRLSGELVYQPRFETDTFGIKITNVQS
jgi:hypothetical protein